MTDKEIVLERVLTYLREQTVDKLFLVALSIAYIAHESDIRKIAHVLDVAEALMPRSNRLAVVGLLHDTIEDGVSNEEHIDTVVAAYRNIFGDEITDAVLALTWDKSKEDYHEDYLPRVTANAMALEVKRVDMTQNKARLHQLENPHVRKALETRYSRGLEILDAA